MSPKLIHFLDWEACETLCGIDSPAVDEIVEDERDAEVSCPTCKEKLAAFYEQRESPIYGPGVTPAMLEEHRQLLHDTAAERGMPVPKLKKLDEALDTARKRALP